MTAEVRIWLGTVVGGLIVAGVGVYDAFINHQQLLSAVGDSTFILAGAGVIAGKAIFEMGVQVPTLPSK